MSINIKNPEVETLLNYIVEQTGETKTEAVRVALLERYQRLVHQAVSLSREERLPAGFWKKKCGPWSLRGNEAGVFPKRRKKPSWGWENWGYDFGFVGHGGAFLSGTWL